MDKNNSVNLSDNLDETKQNICRLCSMKSGLIDMFAPRNVNLPVRILILLSTGIEIRENDVVSKKVCHRCCEIAVKLHKYKSNAIANDKMLKEQIGLPYTPPISDQNEILRMAASIVGEQKDPSNGNENLTKNSRDPLELLLFQKDTVNNNKSSAINLLKSGKNNNFTRTRKFRPKAIFKHPSVQALCNSYKNIILPLEVMKSDISPVISLDRSEISDWYTEQLIAIKSKLKGVTIKEVPHTTVPPVTIALNKCKAPPTNVEVTPFKQISTTPLKQNIVDSPNHNTTVPSVQITRPLFKQNTISPSNHNTPVSSISNTTSRKHTVLSNQTNTINTLKNDALPRQQTRKRPYYGIFVSSSDDSDNADREDVNSDRDIPRAASPKSATSVSKINVSHQVSTDQQVATSSNSITPSKQPIARKRTARRSSYTKRRRVSSKEGNTNKSKRNDKKDNSDIPLKTNNGPDNSAHCEINFVSSKEGNINKSKRNDKKDNSNIPLKAHNGPDNSAHCEINLAYILELPQKRAPEKAQQEVVNTSHLNSNEPPPELIKGKTLQIFMCPVCNKLYDTKKDLVDHERTHLKCKFCKKRLRNLTLLNKHQNETCYINIVKNKPIIKLSKVDTIPSIINQYPDAFKQPCEGEQTVVMMPSKSTLVENEQIVVSTDSTTANNDQNSTVVCISDDSGDEIECMVVPRHKMVDNPFTSKTVLSSPEKLQNGTVDLTLDNKVVAVSDKQPKLLTSSLAEKEIIRSLFKKHSYPAEKVQKETQTFLASNFNVKYTNTNLIILDSMFPELSVYKVPIHLESQPKISARFKENVGVVEPTGSLECWAFIKAIGIQKRALVHANPKQSVTPTNKSVTLNELFVNSQSGSKMRTSCSNISKPLLLKKSTALEAVTPNINRSLLKPATTVPFTLASTPGTNFYNGTSTSTVISLNPTTSFTNAKQATPNFVQFIDPSSTIQFQTPLVPQTSGSLVLGMNQIQTTSQPTQPNVLHVNNNVTNVNKYYMVTNNVSQIPPAMSNMNYGQSYNLCTTNLLLPREKSVEITEVDTTDQNTNSSIVLLNSNNKSTQPNNKLRVKNLSELN